MRTDLIIATDEEYEELLVNESDVQCVPCFGDTIIIGNNEYSVTMNMAGMTPIPSRGMASPRRAILGMACTILARPIMGLSSFLI